jgi:hypothetical protein
MGVAARVFDLAGDPEAMACTILGEFALVTRARVEELLASEDQEIQR